MMRRIQRWTFTAFFVGSLGCGDDGGTGAEPETTSTSTGSTSEEATSTSSTTSGAATGGSGSGGNDSSTGAAEEPVRVRMSTELGDMVFEIYAAEAPITAANFLTYVDDELWAGASFYRTVTADNQTPDEVQIAVIQGGLNGVGSLPAIEHESTDITGLEHLDGTLSMARAAVGTANSEFFVCIGDQPELDFGGTRNPDGQGFAAFGRLVEGVDVAAMIHESPESAQTLTPAIEITSIAREP